MLAGIKVLLVCEEVTETSEVLMGLSGSGVNNVKVVSVQDNFLKMLGEFDTDLIVLDVARPSSALFEQFAMVYEYCPKPVVCFSQDSDSNLIARSVQAGVSAYIVDGKTSSRIKPILEVALMRFKECYAIRKELEQVKDKLSERGVIERAKGLLIEHKNMTEDQAYQAMRKMAMDKGKKISVIAHEVCDVITGLMRA